MPAIKPDRLLGDLYKLRTFGTYKTGVHRPTLSAQDIAAREWFAIAYTCRGKRFPNRRPRQASSATGTSISYASVVQSLPSRQASVRCSRYFSRHVSCEPLLHRICAGPSVRCSNLSVCRAKRLHARLLPWSLSLSVVRPIGACWDR